MTSPADLAVLLSGQVRSFVDLAVRDSWRAHLESLCAGASCTPHLFLCSDLGGCDAVARQPPATAAEWRAAVADFSRGYRLAYENSSERCDHAEAMMRCSSEEERWCTGPGKPSCDADDAQGNSSTLDSRQAKFAGALAKFRSRTSAGRSVRAPRHQLGFARWRHCFARVVAAEATSGRRYDWVLVSRFDVGFFGAPPPLATWAERGRGVFFPSNHGIMSDHWALMGREHADAYMHTIAQLCCRGRCAPPIWNEALLRAQLVVAGVPLRPGFVPWVLLRRMTNGSVVADCARHEKCALTCSRSPGHHAAVKVAGSPLPFVMPECWPPCPREEETLEQCARAFANVGSVTNACREGRC